VSFYAAPGELTALMGGSGAGKTTTMDVVLGRKTVGLIRGDILVNGGWGWAPGQGLLRCLASRDLPHDLQGCSILEV
jgi:ABC-type multidrug transport system ATPase subunit